MSCNCSETYKVTDTWEDSYYIVPKVSQGDLKEVPGCDCGDKAPSGPPINGEQQYANCAGPSNGTFQGGNSPTQTPQEGEKVAIGEPKKTGSKKEPDKPKCSGNCGSSPGPITIIKDEKTKTDKKTITVEYEVKDVTLRCSCPDQVGNDMTWEIPCSDYKVKVDVKADIYKRVRVQQYTVSVSCKN